MTKRSKRTLFGLLALIAAFGLILTGCPDAGGSGGSSGPGPIPTVIREAGSQGTAGTGAITGLEAGKKYLVKKGSGETAQWYTVTSAGELSENPLAALTAEAAADTEALDTDPDGDSGTDDGVTAITDLENGVTYGVYLYGVLAHEGDVGGEGSAVENGGLNAVLNISALVPGNTAAIVAGAGTAAEPSTLIFLIDSGVTAQRAYPDVVALDAQTDIQGSGENALNFSFSGTAADGAKVQAKAGDAFITVSNVGATTATTITASTNATKVRLGAGSRGTAGAAGITGLPTSAKYVVYNGTGWFAVSNSGALVSIAGLTPTDISGAANFGDLGGGAITGLTAGTTYTVYQYFGTVATTNAIPTDLNNGGYNAIFNTSTLTDTQSVTVSTDTNRTGPSTLIFLTDAPIKPFKAINEATDLANQKDIWGTRYYNFTTANAGGAKVRAATGEAFITLSNVGAGTQTILSVATAPSTTPTAVELVSGSPGTAGDKRITGLTAGHYLVKDVYSGKWYSTVNSGAVLVEFENDPTDFKVANFPSAAAAIPSSGTEIIDTTNLKNGYAYEVYRYFGTVATTNAIPTTTALDNGKKNAVYNISTLTTVGNSVSVAADAGAATDKPSLIFIIANAIAPGQSALNGASLAGVQAIKDTRADPTNLVYEFTTADNAGNGAKIEIADGEKFIKLSNVGATTATTLKVVGVKLAAGSPGTAGGDGKITGLATAQFLLKNLRDDKWYSSVDGGTVVQFDGDGALTATMPSGAASIGSGASGTITGLENGTTYAVYSYATLADEGTVATNVYNKVVDISALAGGTSVSVPESAGDGTNSIIFLIDDAVAAGSAIAAGTALANQEIANTAASPDTLYYTFATTADNDAKVQVANGAAYIELSNVGAATVTTLKVVGVKLAQGSQGTAGHKEITGLTNGSKYLVHDVDDNDWYVVETNTTGAIATSALTNGLTFNGADTTVALSSVTKVIGLTNGKTYSVYLYKTDGSALAVDSTLTGGKNAAVNVSNNVAITVSAGAGSLGSTLIVLTEAALTNSGATFVSESTPTGEANILKSGKTWTIAVDTSLDLGTAKIKWAAEDHFFTITPCDLTTKVKVTRSE